MQTHRDAQRHPVVEMSSLLSSSAPRPRRGADCPLSARTGHLPPRTLLKRGSRRLNGPVVLLVASCDPGDYARRGLMVSKVSPETASTHPPSMSILLGCDAGSRSRSSSHRHVVSSSSSASQLAVYVLSSIHACTGCCSISLAGHPAKGVTTEFVQEVRRPLMSGYDVPVTLWGPRSCRRTCRLLLFLGSRQEQLKHVRSRRYLYHVVVPSVTMDSPTSRAAVLLQKNSSNELPSLRSPNP